MLNSAIFIQEENVNFQGIWSPSLVTSWVSFAARHFQTCFNLLSITFFFHKKCFSRTHVSCDIENGDIVKLRRMSGQGRPFFLPISWHLKKDQKGKEMIFPFRKGKPLSQERERNLVTCEWSVHISDLEMETRCPLNVCGHRNRHLKRESRQVSIHSIPEFYNI